MSVQITQGRAEEIIRELQPMAPDDQIHALAAQLRRLLAADCTCPDVPGSDGYCRVHNATPDRAANPCELIAGALLREAGVEISLARVAVADSEVAEAYLRRADAVIVALRGAGFDV